MAKRLLLMRHAKSSWSDPELSDAERPLNKRGLRDAPRMGGRLRERLAGTRPTIVASTALRSRATANLLAGELGIAEAAVRILPELYLATPAELASAVELLDDALECVLLVGHNPGMTEFAAEMSGEALGHLPTCGVVALSLPVSSWVDTRPGSGTVLWLDCPKRPGQL